MIENFSDHGSNERTFLAWVRTAISIVGFGLATARLGSEPAPVWSEVAMLTAGALVVVIAYLRMRHIRLRISAQKTYGADKMPSDAFLLLLIAALFALLTIFVIHVGRNIS